MKPRPPDFAMTEPFHLVAEYTRTQNPTRGLDDVKLGQVGFTYAISKDIVADATCKEGFGPESPGSGVGIGIAIQF